MKNATESHKILIGLMLHYFLQGTPYCRTDSRTILISEIFEEQNDLKAEHHQMLANHISADAALRASPLPPDGLPTPNYLA